MLGLTEFMVLFTSVMAGVPFVLAPRRVSTFVVTPHRSSGSACSSEDWKSGPGAREAFATGGFRALIDRSPMRYDVATHLGGAA